MKIEEILIGSTTIKFYDDYVEISNSNDIERAIVEAMMNKENKNIVI